MPTAVIISRVRPAVGVPITMSSVPVNRPIVAARAACNTWKTLALSAAAMRCNASRISAGTGTSR